MRAALKTHATYAEYLEFERTATEKHEYFDGVIYGMAGGTPEHAILAANLTHRLLRLIGDRPCVVASSDLRILVEATGLSTYPDLSVVCGPLVRALGDPHAITNPVLLVEVLSDSTEAYDRGQKFAHYRRLGSLREYVLVSQREKRVEVFRRTGDGHWLLDEAAAGERLALESLGGAIAVDDVYRGVELGDVAVRGA